MIKVTASLMCANMSDLEKEIRLLEKSGIDGFHIDMMDGKFVPNTALDISDIKTVRNLTRLPIDTHMMVNDAKKDIEQIADAGSDIIVFHAEGCEDISDTLQLIKDRNKKGGVALNPETGTDVLKNDLNLIDVVLFMATRPGFTGQPFEPEVINKISKFTKFLDKKRIEMDITADGSVNPSVIKQMARAGVNFYVGGSTGLFNTVSFSENIKEIKNIAQKYYKKG